MASKYQHKWPSVNDPQFPWLVRRDRLCELIAQRGTGGMVINTKWVRYTDVGNHLDARDLRRLVKDGYATRSSRGQYTVLFLTEAGYERLSVPRSTEAAPYARRKSDLSNFRLRNGI